jgi:hypothetical protein
MTGPSGAPLLSTTASASTLAARDSNSNLAANSHLSALNNIVTSGGTTTLTAASAEIQYLSGTSAHTVVLPTTGIAAGQHFEFVNFSTGYVTINASNGSAIQLVPPGGFSARFRTLISTPTVPGHWALQYLANYGYTVSATAACVAVRDSNANVLANAFVPGGTSTPTAAGTTTLTSASTEVQIFTGSTTQTVVLPTTGVTAGQRYRVINNSTGAVTVNASDASGILSIVSTYSAEFTALVNTPTNVGHWRFSFLLSVGVSTNTTPSVVALRNGSGGLNGTSFTPSLATTATAAGTTTLVVSSAEIQAFTGATTQTVTLPTTSVAAGQRFTVINNSSGAVTVNSSGANLVKTVAAGASTVVTALQATPTTAAHWYASA